MRAHKRDFVFYMSFLIKDDELLKNYNRIWDKVSYSMEKGFDSEPAYNEKYHKENSANILMVIGC